MNVLVIGCGNLGSRLADELWYQGHHVSVIDSNEESFLRLSDDFDGIMVTGMPMDITVLKNAGIEGCDAVAVVTSDDNLNITISQIIKKLFDVQNVIARITDPAREKVFNQFGLKTICQTNISSGVIISALIEDVNDQQLSFGTTTVSFNMRNVDPILVGRTLDVVPTKNGETIVGLLKDNGTMVLYDGRQKIVINPSDKIVYSRVIG